MKLRRGPHSSDFFDRCFTSSDIERDRTDNVIRYFFEPQNGKDGFPLERKSVFAVDLDWDDVLRAVELFAEQGNVHAQTLLKKRQDWRDLARQLTMLRQQSQISTKTIEDALTYIEGDDRWKQVDNIDEAAE